MAVPSLCNLSPFITRCSAVAEGPRDDLGHLKIFGRPFVKRFALCYQTVVCPVLSCLSMTLVHCGQTVGRIKKKLGTRVGLDPGHIVLDGDPAPLPQRATPPIFGPYLLRPNGCMDQNATWYGGRPRPKRLCVRCGPTSRSQKGTEPPNFWPMLIVAKRLEVGLSPGYFVLDGDPAPSQKGGGASLPNFRPISIVAKRQDASRCHLAWR